MSRKYEKGSEVPTTLICQRLTELSEAVAEGKKGIEREFTMRVPAELDRDPDLVMSIAASRLSRLQAENSQLKDKLRTAEQRVSQFVEVPTPNGYGYVRIEDIEQRVARECCNEILRLPWAIVETARDTTECYVSRDDAVDAIKQKYHIED